MTAILEKSVCFGVDWATAPPRVAGAVPLAVADATDGLHTVTDRDGNTPLHWAAAYNSPKVVARFLCDGAFRDEENEGGNTPLHFAAALNKNPDVIRTFAKFGAKHEKNKSGETPLMMAVRYNNVEVAEVLADKSGGAHLWGDIGGTGTSIFWVAENVQSSEMAYAIASAGWAECCITVADEGGLVPLKNEDGHTPLQCAVLAGNVAAVSGFINAWMVVVRKDDADYDEKIKDMLSVVRQVVYGSIIDGQESILHFAARNGASSAIVKALIDAGVDVNCLSVWGRTPLDYAVAYEKRRDIADAAVVLCEAGGYTCDKSAGVCFGVNWKTATPADVVGINHDDRGGRFFGAPIHWAARFCPNPEVIVALVASGADVNENRAEVKGDSFEAMRRRGMRIKLTPIRYAVEKNNPAVISALINAGANVNEGRDTTPLDIADKRGDKEVREVLIKAGAVNFADL